jgi:hypothetical protein
MTLQSTTTTAAPAPRAGWLVPAGLIVLSFVPVLAGAVRVTELTAGAGITPDNARFFAMPVPVVLHIAAASVFSVFGAFQFAPGLRRRRPHRHRIAGRVLVPSGLVVALSGLWMTLLSALPAGDRGLLTVFRLVRLRHGGLPRARLRRRPAARRGPASRLDDPGVRDRHGRGHAGGHPLPLARGPRR